MEVAPLPSNEDFRLEVLRRYQILDSDPEVAFERITALAQRLFDVPIVLVSLVDVDRQWFKSCIGLDTRTTSRDVSFCAHAILSDEVLVVPDAKLDPRFADNPDVLGGPHIRFYAGAPLTTSDGASLGTLCVIDSRPRAGLTPEETQTLRDLASIVVDEMELRLALRTSVEREEELKRAKAAAQEASGAKSTFLSRMSHEFRTPLNAILGFVQLLQGEDLTPDQQEDLSHMRKAGDHLLRLLTEALDLSRLESGRIRMVIQDVALAPIAAAAARSAGRDRISVEVDPELRVLADAGHLEDVVTEVVANSLRHAGEDARVRLSAARSGDTVELRVSDDGSGMEPDDVERLFEPFERGSGASGLGLGLTIARRTVWAMGGALRAVSAPGEGTTTTVALPAGTSGGSGEGETASILYVDDNLANLRLVEKVLTRRPGTRLHVAATGAEGILVAKEELPDLVLLDLHLPDVPGADVLATLRADPRTATTPVVIVTGEDDPAVLEDLLARGAAQVVTKPVDPDELVEIVTSHLAEKAVHSGARTN